MKQISVDLLALGDSSLQNNNKSETFRRLRSRPEIDHAPARSAEYFFVSSPFDKDHRNVPKIFGNGVDSSILPAEKSRVEKSDSTEQFSASRAAVATEKFVRESFFDVDEEICN